MVHNIQQRDRESSRGAVVHQIQPVKERLATAAVMEPQMVHKIQQRDHESSRGAVVHQIQPEKERLATAAVMQPPKWSIRSSREIINHPEVLSSTSPNQ